jgi:hypothetical protein
LTRRRRCPRIPDFPASCNCWTEVLPLHAIKRESL